MRCAISMARPMPPVSPCALWRCSGPSTPTGRARAATTQRGARRSTTSMASNIIPTGSTICSSPPPWEGENYEQRNPMKSAQFGATMGRQFSYELLQAVSQLDASTLQRELGRLVEAEIVYQRGLPPQATYMFKHALIQDAAYQSLLKSTKQGYHQRIAQVLETQFPETTEGQPELIAHHVTEARRK